MHFVNFPDEALHSDALTLTYAGALSQPPSLPCRILLRLTRSSSTLYRSAALSVGRRVCRFLPNWLTRFLSNTHTSPSRISVAAFSAAIAAASSRKRSVWSTLLRLTRRTVEPDCCAGQRDCLKKATNEGALDLELAHSPVPCVDYAQVHEGACWDGCSVSRGRYPSYARDMSVHIPA